MEIIDPARINRDASSYFDRLKRVERFVQAHYGERISRRKVAGVAALEEKYFSTFFREKTGVRFRGWLTLVRVSRAMVLLRGHNHPISIVASKTGFPSLRTFERSFKRCTGITPRGYKKRSLAPWGPSLRPGLAFPTSRRISRTWCRLSRRHVPYCVYQTTQ